MSQAMRRWGLALLVTIAVPAVLSATDPLRIYFIDVEGGQSTLVVTPAGESLLIDAGFPSDDALIGPAYGTPPGVAAGGRDPKRILAAVKDAGLSQIDYLLLTHFHADHAGGVLELSELLPIKTFIDHGRPAPDADVNVPGSTALFERYAVVRAKGRHMQPKPGDVLPLAGVDVRFLSSGGETISSPLRGAGQPNPACGEAGLPAQEKVENPASIGVRLAFGQFRFVNVGDLSGPPLHALACPNNLLGAAEVYLVTHHGGVDAAGPEIFEALKPLVAVINNGPTKGGHAATLATVRRLGIDGWQLHRSLNPGVENAPEDYLANLDESTSAWIKITASEDGSFTVTNGRTGYAKTYRRQR